MSECDAYGNGWCCTSGASVVEIGVFEVSIFSGALSFILIMMVIYLLIQIGVHYYDLHNPPKTKPVSSTSSLLEKRRSAIPGHTGTPIKQYNSISSLESPVPQSPIRGKNTSLIQTSDFEYSATQDDDGVTDFTDNETFSRDYIMELPDRQYSQSSLINVYRQYEKQLGVASKFESKKKTTDEKPGMRGFHFIYLLLLATWFIIESVLLFTGTPTTKAQKFIDSLVYLMHGIFYFLKNILFIFLFIYLFIFFCFRFY